MYGQRKFKNKRELRDGRSFASKFEATLYDQLKEREENKEIGVLECQVSVYLTEAKILYKPDFRAFDNGLGVWVWFEAKGFETDVWRIKKRLWKCYGPGRLEIYKGSYKSGAKLVEVLSPC